MDISTIFICVLILTVLLLLTIVTYVIYSGLFHTVEVGAGKPPIKNVHLVYKFGRGPYKDTGYVYTEATSIAPKHRCIGVFYDDPNQVPARKLRWAVGSIVSEGDEVPDAKIVTLFKKNGFNIFNLPQVSNVVRTTFPHRTALSTLIGIFKVYPLLGEYVRINKLCAHPWIEICDNKETFYMAPLAKQDEFYVPEALNIDCDNDDEENDTNPMETLLEESEIELESRASTEVDKSACIKETDLFTDSSFENTQCVEQEHMNVTEVKLVNGAGDAQVNGYKECNPVHDESLQLHKMIDDNTKHTPEKEILVSTPYSNGESNILCPENAHEENVQDGGVSSSTVDDAPSRASSIDSSRVSAESETSTSASYYTSQSEYSDYTSQSMSGRSDSVETSSSNKFNT